MRFLLSCAAILALVLLRIDGANAGKIDIQGPEGSVAFGSSVLTLPNGNFAVADPEATSGAGAVSLYDHTGQFISVLRGRGAGDHIGSYGLVAVGASNFVVLSPSWQADAGQLGGAVTWVDGTIGQTGVVSSSNSITGTRGDLNHGSLSITPLNNGNYVIVSPGWNDGLGAATWCNGAGGTVGAISAANSLVGVPGNSVAWRGVIFAYPNTGVLPLANGNYVVTSSLAVTWGSGNTGVTGEVSVANSLLSDAGTTFVYPLANGNYVATFINWHGVGAAAWGNGSAGTVGAVSSSNALVGTLTADAVGSGVLALSNGNYVVLSSGWHNSKGALTWGNGTTGVAGPVSTSNSLVGANVNDSVAITATPLCNGNYVVGSPDWMSGAGAATWLDGELPAVGTVSATNSLIGSASASSAGFPIFALANCNYVVATAWYDSRGAATWADGSIGLVGTVSSKNSLVGASAQDYTGTVVPLSNGNYLVTSSNWNGGTGAVTWADGTHGLSGAVSAAKSLVGAAAGDHLGYSYALPNGNYLVASDYWNGDVGSVTWGNGFTGITGVVSSSNSMFGAAPGYRFGSGGISVYADNMFAVASPIANGLRGAVTLGNGNQRQVGVAPASLTVEATNVSSQVGSMPFSYDTRYHQLIVGRLDDNLVTIVTMDAVFNDGFEN
jgi:hypothetical protein